VIDYLSGRFSEGTNFLVRGLPNYPYGDLDHFYVNLALADHVVDQRNKASAYYRAGSTHERDPQVIIQIRSPCCRDKLTAKRAPPKRALNKPPELAPLVIGCGPERLEAEAWEARGKTSAG
jgi:hypothetical protein